MLVRQYLNYWHGHGCNRDTHVAAACVIAKIPPCRTHNKRQPGECYLKIFVAGASGAIGQPLIATLVRNGHTVTGMSRDEAGTQKLVDMGVTVAIVNAFDGAAVEQALRRSQAEVHRP